MPTVISKYIDDISKQSISKKRVGSGLAAAAFLLCACKLSYPYVSKIFKTSSQNKPLIISNNNKNEPTEADEAEKATRTLLPGFNTEFVIQFKKLNRIVIPGLR